MQLDSNFLPLLEGFRMNASRTADFTYSFMLKSGIALLDTFYFLPKEKLGGS